LKRFGEQAQAPMLLNTSFNLFGEPLVVTPRDAVRSYFSSGIDALIVDNFVLSKATVRVPSNLAATTSVRLSA
jgi:carbamoyltransferase